MKPELLIAANHDTMLNLGCVCEVCFLTVLEARIVPKKWQPRKLAPNWFGLLGGLKKKC